MGELGGELWGLVCLVVDVILRGVISNSDKSGDSFHLTEIKRSAFFKDTNKQPEYPGGRSSGIREVNGADIWHFQRLRAEDENEGDATVVARIRAADLFSPSLTSFQCFSE